jgi:hypothetical protein
MGGASAGSGGSDSSDERKVDTYADQLKKAQKKKSKTTIDKFGYTVPKKKSFAPPGVAIVKGIFGNAIDKSNLNRRMKFANKTGVQIQGLSTEEILSKDFKAQLDGMGYSDRNNTGGNDNRDDNNNQTVLSTNTEATKQVASSGVVTNNGVIAPTNAEVTQAQSTDMSADQILLANNKKGRKQTILNNPDGLGSSTANTTKKTLGA